MTDWNRFLWWTHYFVNMAYCPKEVGTGSLSHLDVPLLCMWISLIGVQAFILDSRWHQHMVTESYWYHVIKQTLFRPSVLVQKGVYSQVISSKRESLYVSNTCAIFCQIKLSYTHIMVNMTFLPGRPLG